jgi:thermitase
MKTLNSIVWLVIAASLLVVSPGVSGETCLIDINKIPGHNLSAPAALSASDSTEVNRQRAKNVSVADVSFSNSASIIPFEQALLNDPYVDKQWALSQIEAPRLWQITAGNPGIIVAVLDTGIDSSHEDLKGKVAAEVNFTDSPTPQDIKGHGTHIAGIAAASSNNGIGIGGLAPESRLMNVKVADDAGKCRAEVIAEGIVWAVDNGASVINISLELKEPSLELENAVNYAWSRGAVIIAAAGNGGSELPAYPAYYENSLAVAATRQDDTLAPLSNLGDWVDVAAPGFNIYSTLPDDSYGYKSGTSFASAYVSGMAALLFDIATDKNGNGRLNDEVRAAIETGSRKVGTRGVGRGRIDAARSLTHIGSTP